MNSYIARDQTSSILEFFRTLATFLKIETKLGSSSDIGIFLGYSSNSCVYLVHNLKTSVVMESINVVINDSIATKMVEIEGIQCV